MTPVLGAVVGAYRLDELVASDPLGTVYTAYDGSGIRHLLRLLTPLAGDPEARRRFQIEFAAIARLDHPGILRVEDWGEWEATPYVVTADAGGERLSAVLASGRRLNPRFVLRALRDLASALDHAHLLGVVHGAVAPDRVLVAADGSVRLTDFGLTALVGAGPDRDVFALAGMAGSLLTMAPPAPALASDVDAVLRRGLAEDPQRRWETCGAMVDALEEALRGRAAPPQASGPLWRRLGVGPLPRRLPLWVGLGAAALLVLLVAVALLGQALRPSPTLALAPATANAGDTVVVSGDHLPAGQPGTVVMVGRPAPLGQFQADGGGAFRFSFVVPAGLGGSQTIQACWGGSCPISQTLIVPGAPTAPATQAPTQAPIVTPTPVGVTPTPTAGSRRFAPAISLSSDTARRGQTIEVRGSGFDPAQQYVIFLQQAGHRVVLQTPASPDGSGAFSDPVQVPLDARRGRGVVTACVFQVNSRATTSCAQQPVLIGG